jgi:3-deoxy-D-manno-octulosonic acid kinase
MIRANENDSEAKSRETRGEPALEAEPRVMVLGRAFVLYDAAVERAASIDVERWFDRDYWQSAGAPLGEKTGRGAVVVLEQGAARWVLRHYKRGGLVARFVEDHYVWKGLEHTRAFREWRLLAQLRALGLPVPRPIAARVERSGLLYRADIITRYLPGTRPLSAILNEAAAVEVWAEIGAMIRAFHDCGVDHPDLTAHNILMAPEGKEVFLVDFDNAHVRPKGRWQDAGLARLERSLRKVALETGVPFDPDGWRLLEEAYRATETSGGAHASLRARTASRISVKS